MLDAYSGDVGVLIGVLAFLLVFGAGFHYAVDWAHQRGYMEGYTWLAVVVGVAGTVAPMGLIIGWPAVLWLALAFAITGAFMAFGDIRRHLRERERELQVIRELEGQADE